MSERRRVRIEAGDRESHPVALDDRVAPLSSLQHIVYRVINLL